MRIIFFRTLSILVIIFIFVSCQTNSVKNIYQDEKKLVNANSSSETERLYWMDYYNKLSGKKSIYHYLARGRYPSQFTYSVGGSNGNYSLEINNTKESKQVASLITRLREINYKQVVTFEGTTYSNEALLFSQLQLPEYLYPGIEWNTEVFNGLIKYKCLGEKKYTYEDGKEYEAFFVEAVLPRDEITDYFKNVTIRDEIISYLISPEHGIVQLKSYYLDPSGIGDINSELLLSGVVSIGNHKEHKGFPYAVPDNSLNIRLLSTESDNLSIHFSSRSILFRNKINPDFESSTGVLYKVDISSSGVESPIKSFTHPLFQKYSISPSMRDNTGQNEYIDWYNYTQNVDTFQDVGFLSFNQSTGFELITSIKGKFYDDIQTGIQNDSGDFFFFGETGTQDFGYGFNLKYKGKTDAWMIRTDNRLQVKNMALIGGNWWETALDAFISKDDYIYMIGEASSGAGSSLKSSIPGPDYISRDILLGKLNLSGDVVWLKRIGGPLNEVAEFIHPLNNSNFLISYGITEDTIRRGETYILAQYDQSGNKVRNWIDGEENGVAIHSIVNSRDGEYVYLVGSITEDQNSQLYLAKHTINGEKKWEQIYRGNREERGIDLVETNSGLLYLLCSTKSTDFPGFNYEGIEANLILKLDSNGNMLYE